MSQESAVLLGAAVCGLILVLYLTLRSGRESSAAAAPKEGVPERRPGDDAGHRDASGLRPRPKRPPSELQIQVLEPADWSDDDDVTVVRVDVESTGQHGKPQALAQLFVADAGADVDEPTLDYHTIITSAGAQSDIGRRRRRNDDRYLTLAAHNVYAVADGMGGYAGGGVAAQIAVDTLAACFERGVFDAVITSDHTLPNRAAELVRAVQDANLAVHQHALTEVWLKNMGTTLVAARFAPRKSRLYIAHVGDSRCYRLRGGTLKQLTSDHTLGAETDLDAEDPSAGCLSRAIGVAPRLTVDLIIAKPLPGDVYLLSTDGLTRMVEDDGDLAALLQDPSPTNAARELVATANARGGRDNITAVVVRVAPIAAISATA